MFTPERAPCLDHKGPWDSRVSVCKHVDVIRQVGEASKWSVYSLITPRMMCSPTWVTSTSSLSETKRPYLLIEPRYPMSDTALL